MARDDNVEGGVHGVGASYLMRGEVKPLDVFWSGGGGKR